MGKPCSNVGAASICRTGAYASASVPVAESASYMTSATMPMISHGTSSPPE